MVINWSEIVPNLINSESQVPCDITFKIFSQASLDESVNTKQEEENKENEETVEGEDCITAHKIILAAVSPVFCRNFCGSFNNEKVINIKDTSHKAFKQMIDYIYKKSACGNVRNFVDAIDILDLFYLAEKYQVLGMKEEIISRLSSFNLGIGDFEPILDAIREYSYLEEACNLLESHVVDFIKFHDNPLKLVKGAVDCNKDSIKDLVLLQLALVDVGKGDVIHSLEIVKAAQDIHNSKRNAEDNNADSFYPIMKICAKSYEASLKFSDFFPSLDYRLHGVFVLLREHWENKADDICYYCESTNCKKGQPIFDSVTKIGLRVLVEGEKEGFVKRIGLIRRPKLFPRDSLELIPGMATGPGWSMDMSDNIGRGRRRDDLVQQQQQHLGVVRSMSVMGPGLGEIVKLRRQVVTVYSGSGCPFCQVMNHDLLVSRGCNGAHTMTELVRSNVSIKEYEIQLDSGALVSVDFKDVVLDCQHLSC